MKRLDQWLGLYAVSHQNKTNQRIHKICVPLIALSTLGLVHELPGFWPSDAWVSWAALFLIGSLLFYFRLSAKIGLGMTVIGLIALALVHWFKTLAGAQTWMVFAAVWIAAWIGQFVGHQIEGKKPSLIDDLTFLWIGPVWVAAPLLGVDRPRQMETR